MFCRDLRSQAVGHHIAPIVAQTQNTRTNVIEILVRWDLDQNHPIIMHGHEAVPLFPQIVIRAGKKSLRGLGGPAHKVTTISDDGGQVAVTGNTVANTAMPADISPRLTVCLPATAPPSQRCGATMREPSAVTMR